MIRRYLLFIISFFIVLSHALGQDISFADSIKAYNSQRIKINTTGYKVLGAWGLVNIAAGGIGYFDLKQEEGKYFSEMNGIWGIVHTGFATAGLLMARKQKNSKLNFQQSYDQYRSDKKLYLIASGVDIIYIGVGLGLTAHASSSNNAALFNGFGKSIALQGVFLLLFNNVMLMEHQAYSNKWYRLMDEIRFTGNGIGFSHSF